MAGIVGVLSFYRQEVALAIEVREGLNHFYSLHHGGTYHSIYKIHDGVWYEQLLGIFTGDTKTRPDAFLVYKRIDK